MKRHRAFNEIHPKYRHFFPKPNFCEARTLPHEIFFPPVGPNLHSICRILIVSYQHRTRELRIILLISQHCAVKTTMSSFYSATATKKNGFPNYCMATSPEQKTLSKPVIFASAGLGGCMGWAVVHPFNTAAVRSNLASASGQTFSISKMLKTDGFMSLYDGLSAGIARQVFYATSRFGLFETFRDILHEYRGKTDFASR